MTGEVWRIGLTGRWALLVLGLALLVASVLPAPAVANPVGQITEFSSGLNSGSQPRGIVEGPDGNLWFDDNGSTKAIGRLKLATGQITEFSSGLNAGSFPRAIAMGPDGNVWFTDDGTTKAIGRIAPATGQITEFTTGLSASSAPIAIAPGPDGNLWFTDDGSTKAIGKINPSTGEITEFTSGLNPTSFPRGIAPGADGNLWFTDTGQEAIGRINPVTGHITEFSSGLNPGSQPVWIAPGPDGNLWFTDDGSTTAIGKIIPSTGKIDEFSTGLNTGSTPVGIAAGPDGSVWFADFAGAIGQVNTSNGQITEFTTGLNSGSLPVGMTAGLGNEWFADGAGAVGRVGTGAPTAIQSTPTVSGPAQVGHKETCNAGTWATWVGVSPSLSLYSFDGYHWLRDGVPIAGAHGHTYIPSSADLGHQLACQATATYPLPFLVTAPASSTAVRVTRLPAPVLSRLRVSPRKVPLTGRLVRGHCVGVTNRNRGHTRCALPIRLRVVYALSIRATVTLTLKHVLGGRRVNGKCVRQTKTNRGRPLCIRLVVVSGRIIRTGSRGVNAFVFDGRIGGHRLGPGSYLLILAPTANRQTGTRRSLSFEIIP